jgi:hypothetical protein
MFRRGGLEPNIRQGAFGALLAVMKSGQADIALEIFIFGFSRLLKYARPVNVKVVGVWDTVGSPMAIITATTARRMTECVIRQTWCQTFMPHLRALPQIGTSN